MTYGKDGNKYFVNSGDYVFGITGGAELIGNVTNRREIESMGYSRRTAHALVKRLPAAKGIAYASKSALRAMVAEHRAGVRRARCANLHVAPLGGVNSGSNIPCSSGQ